MIILGIDPGTTMIGIGLIDYRNKKISLLGYDCLKTGRTETSAQRLNNLFGQLTKIIKKYRPDAIAVESLFFFKNTRTVISVSQARGIILLAAIRSSGQQTKICEYTPLQIKQALTGYGRAEKRQIQQMVKVVLNLKDIPRPDDAADALACAICCAHSMR